MLQRGYDTRVSGATVTETKLTTANVVPGRFGLVFKLHVNDNIAAQPLFVPDLVVKGIQHNVLFVATMSDTLYAFDADVGGAPLWTRDLAAFEHATPVPIAQFAYSGNKNIINHLGILSTPVIDPSTDTMYTVTCTLEHDALVYRLHALDITSGVPRPGSGVVISGSHRSITFDARNQTQRASLVLVGNQVVVAFGALEEESSAHLYSGWVLAYDKSSLAQTGVFATVTTGNGGGGVWQSGRPPAVDSSGNLYLIAGNAFGAGGYDGVHNFSETLLKMNPAQGLAVIDWFTPSNWLTLDNLDRDLSSSGPMLIPGTNLVVGGGKTGVLYLLHANNLGRNTATNSGAIQQLHATSMELRGGPVYWRHFSSDSLMYDWGPGDRLKAYSFNGGTFVTTPQAQSSFTQLWPGGILALSANGSTAGTGVLWATVVTSGNAEDNPPVPGELYAFDAGDVTKELWSSDANATRDSFGNFAKFVPPLIANGKVYVATWSNQIAVYGLFTAPVLKSISPTGGTTAGGTSVTLSGRNFTAGTRVSFGGVAALDTIASSVTQLRAVTPAHTQGTLDVIVINPGGASVKLAGGFTFVAP